MRTALLLVDLQDDFLRAPGLQPHASSVIGNAARLLASAREARIPVLHAHTLIDAPGAGMPHWRASRRSMCVKGTPGASPPDALAPIAGEVTVAKQFFSAFSEPALEAHLRDWRIERLLIAGVHLHACVRSTALDAYAKGLEVVIAADAVGSYDPLHAEITRTYLERRAARFEDVGAIGRWLVRPAPTTAPAADEIRLVAPARREHALGTFRILRGSEVSAVAAHAASHQPAWDAVAIDERKRRLLALADWLTVESEALIRQIVRDVGKPLTAARAEVDFARQLVRAAVHWHDSHVSESAGGDWRVRARPHGLVALVTPWNNPLAIPLGKIVPALLYGNAVAWKPAPHGTFLAERVLQGLRTMGLPEGLVAVVPGDRGTAIDLMSCREVDAVSVTGSSQTGYTAHAICAARRIPLQAELGGNNAAIVLPDAPLDETARLVASGAMGFAGQRCTANRRMIVLDHDQPRWIAALRDAIAALAWGSPDDALTSVGPVVSDAACAAFESLIERAVRDGCTIIQPHDAHLRASLREAGSYFPPTLVLAATPDVEIVQEESFGPVLVVQAARDWEHALELCNGVRQGLAAALFTSAADRQREFLARCQAGILKINAATAAVAAEPAFCGWKASGVGPPEHGVGDWMFYARLQTVYGADATTRT